MKWRECWKYSYIVASEISAWMHFQVFHFQGKHSQNLNIVLVMILVLKKKIPINILFSKFVLCLNAYVLVFYPWVSAVPWNHNCEFLEGVNQEAYRIILSLSLHCRAYCVWNTIWSSPLDPLFEDLPARFHKEGKKSWDGGKRVFLKFYDR